MDPLELHESDQVKQFAKYAHQWIHNGPVMCATVTRTYSFEPELARLCGGN